MTRRHLEGFAPASTGFAREWRKPRWRPLSGIRRPAGTPKHGPGDSPTRGWRMWRATQLSSKTGVWRASGALACTMDRCKTKTPGHASPRAGRIWLEDGEVHYESADHGAWTFPAA